VTLRLGRTILVALAWAGPALAQTQPPADSAAPAAPAAEAAPAAPAAATTPAVPESMAKRTDFQIGLTTLEALHKKGLLSDAEYQAALSDLIEVGERAKTENTFVVGKFATTMYGFIEGDLINDSTQSFTESAGMGAILRPGTAGGGGDHGRTMMAVRNSRLGFRLKAPEVGGIRPSALLEMDFLGNQPGTPPNDSSTPYKESSFFNNPTFRVRHFLFKAENDFVNVWVGQTWELVGWQGGYQPNTVQIQGIPGELYSRTAQIRLERAFDLGPVNVDLAVAALRPPQMDSAIPDFQGGIKLSVDAWKGVQSASATGNAIVPASVGFSGGVRQFKLPSATGYPTTTGNIAALDLILPIIPAKERSAWAMTVVAEGAKGTGIADLYTGLSGGAGLNSPAGYSAPPATTTCSGTLAPSYANCQGDIDPGLAGWTNAGSTLSTVDWQTFIISGQLYLPPDGKLWLSGAYSNSVSDNITSFGAANKVFWHETWWDANIFADVHPAIRLGLEFSRFTQTYGDGVQANNNRVQFSGFFIF
jgi:hypothetical protein